MTQSTGLSRQGLCNLFDIPFTDEQLDAITAPHAPAVVIAGAGSGKTALMSARVVWLVARGQVAPDQVLGLTFTNKAAVELSTRVRRALRLLDSSGESTGEPTISTYHAYAAALIREYGLWAGYEPAAQLLTDAQRVQLAESVVRRAPGPFSALRVRLTALTERVVTLDGELNEHLVDLPKLIAHDTALINELDGLELAVGKLTADPAKARETARARLELAPLVAEFRRVKAARERVDFGDQMAAAALLSETVAEVSRGERERFSTVLLDEYQDTSMAQQRLLVALFGAGHPVMAVGDPFQSIYGWRGASVRNILTFDRDFADQNPAPIFALGQNNRSGGRILAAANTIAEPLRGRFPEVAELRPQLAKAASGDVVVGLYRTAAEEIEVVCDSVAAEVAAGRAPSDIAVLCRESKVFPQIIEGLTSRAVPVDVVGLSGLLELPEIAEVVAILEVLHDPTANPSLVRLLAGPRWRIGAADLAQLGSRARDLVGSVRRSTSDGASEQDESVAAQLLDAVTGIDPAETVSLTEALEDPGAGPYSRAARERFAELADELRQLRAVLHQPPDVAIARVVAATGLDIELAVHGTTSVHLDALLEHARGFTSAGGGSGVGGFLSYLALAKRYRSSLAVPAPSGGEGVALLTVHKAKGLEWHSVYVPQVVAGVFPSGQSRSTPLTSPALLPYPLRGDAADFPVISTWEGNQGVAAFKSDVAERERGEDRRLAYVALTRAAERLVVTGHRWGPTQTKPRGVSPYLQALADHCTAGGGTVAHWEPEVVETTNPALAEKISVAWPATGAPEVAAARASAASAVLANLAASPLSPSNDDLDDRDAERVAAWDADIAALIAEAERDGVQGFELPSALSASWAVQLLRDPDAAVQRLRRPMPRPPAAAAYRGTRFHQWVEARFGQVPLIDADGLVPDGQVEQDDELAALQQAFLAGPYADRQPVAIEAPFQLVLGDEILVGRIDAVYAADPSASVSPDAGPPAAVSPGAVRYEVVDWKTGRHAADPLQLALYRLAWAELHQIPIEQVGACFYYVSTGQIERPSGLPDRAALTEWWDRSRSLANQGSSTPS